MGLEAATYISDLVSTNPVGGTDFVSQGDDHLRLLKATIKASFPGVSGAVTSTHTELNYLDGATGVTGTGNTVRSAAPTFTGAMVADTITGGNGSAASPTYAIASDGGNGWYLSAADTLGWSTGGTERMTLTSSALKIVVQGFEIAHASPQIRFNETDRGTDLKAWLVRVTTDTFRISTATDAAPTTGVSDAITITRNPTTTVSEVDLTGTLLDLNGRLDADGDIQDINGSTSCTLTGTANAVLALTTDGIAATGNLTTPNASASELGFKGLPTATDATPVLTDSGKMILATGNVTIPANASVAYPVGTVITIYNTTGGSINIAVTSDTILLAGTANSGTRALAQKGIAVLTKVTSTTWVAAGAGLS